MQNALNDLYSDSLLIFTRILQQKILKIFHKVFWGIPFENAWRQHMAHSDGYIFAEFCPILEWNTSKDL